MTHPQRNLAMLAAGSFNDESDDPGDVRPFVKLGLQRLMDGMEAHARRRKRAAK